MDYLVQDKINVLSQNLGIHKFADFIFIQKEQTSNEQFRFPYQLLFREENEIDLELRFFSLDYL